LLSCRSSSSRLCTREQEPGYEKWTKRKPQPADLTSCPGPCDWLVFAHYRIRQISPLPKLD
jgi:hypothetical protein